jgi:hypothetical protein
LRPGERAVFDKGIDVGKGIHHLKTQIITTVLTRTAEGITCIAMMMDSFTAIIADDVDDVLGGSIVRSKSSTAKK